MVYRFEVVRPKVLPPNFGIPAESGPPRHALTPDERAGRDQQNASGETSRLETPVVIANSEGGAVVGVAAVNEEEPTLPRFSQLGPGQFSNMESTEDSKPRGRLEWVELRSNRDWNSDWHESQLVRREFDRSQLTRLTELASYEVDVFELGRLGSQMVGPWELESFELPRTSSSTPAWAPAISSQLELTVSLGATAAWLVFHGRMLAAAAAASALREAVDPTQLLGQAVESEF